MLKVMSELQSREYLLDRIKTHKAVVAIIGLGYVGLPLASAFANAGFRVIGIDRDKARVESINRGESYIPDVPTDVLARVTGNIASSPKRQPQELPPYGSGPMLSATTEYRHLAHADAAIVCVPTPLSKTKDPDLSYIIAAADQIAEYLHPGMVIVLESTTYPGTTEEIILPRLQEAHGGKFVAGRDFFLAFSPERIDPGRKDWTLCNTPKVIGGVTPGCLEVAKGLYESVVQQVMPVSSPKVAEMTKLLENTFRATNIALVNEVAIMCNRLGIDVWEVIEAAKTKPFGFMPFYPGPGLGGHCIPIDPRYLAWKLKTLNYNPRFIQLAEEINFGMPGYVLGKIADALNQREKPLKNSRVLLLGVAYKADVNDLRESPALDLIHVLEEKGARVTYHDPYVPRLEVDGLSMSSVHLDEGVMRASDCVVVITGHRSYDWQWVLNNSSLVVDTRNATRKVSSSNCLVVRL